MKRKFWALLISLALVVTLISPVAGTWASETETTPAPVEETATPETQAPETQAPTPVATERVAEDPTEEPTEAPTEEPTEAPTEEPTEAPTEEPTEAPTEEPTVAPTEEPTEAPTEEPTEAPTEEPTVEPTQEPELLTVRVAPDQRSAFEKDTVSATVTLAGGVAPYTVRGIVTCEGKVVADTTVTAETAGAATLSAQAAFGTMRFEVTVTDALGNVATAAAATPVAANDRETESDWRATLRGVELTGDWREDLLAVAKSQLDYQESKRNFIVREDGSVQGYTRYGDWYGLPYEEWCAMFVSFCLNYAEIPAADFPRASGCQKWLDELAWLGLYEDDEDAYAPQPGDLIFFRWENDTAASHVGIVEYVADGYVHTIEGNSAARVRRQEYPLTDRTIIGYANMTEAMDRAGKLEAPAEPELPEEGGLLCPDCYDADGNRICGQDCTCACHPVESLLCTCYDAQGNRTCAEDCSCDCHARLYGRLMECATLEELFALLDATPEEELAALTEAEIAAVEAKIEALEPAPLPAVILESDEPVQSEIFWPTVNYDNVAPFGDPVVGGSN